MKQYAIIVAGGNGTRMGGDIPKQFLMLDKKPVILHAVNCFTAFNPNIPIVLVLPKSHHSHWDSIKQRFDIKADVIIVDGGDHRFYSVKNALERIPADGFVAIHDAVRPLVSVETVAQSFLLAKKHGCAIPYTLPQSSIRIEKNDGSNFAIDRGSIRIIQTPQTFLSGKIKIAYRQHYQEVFTDDATVWEFAQNPVYLFKGNPENIKVTTPLDLKIAEQILLSQKR